MYPYLGDFEAGKTIFFPFNTFNSSGASVTLTGLAVTDIEVYKGASMTQRSSDAGYALVDTDGIDLDGITGIHGFTIDTSDNTDAGFYVAASDYTVVVSSVTVDSQTVNFIVGRFSISNRAGLKPTVEGRTLDVASTGEAGLDFGNVNLPAGPIQALGIFEGGTAQSATSTTLVGRAAATDGIVKAGMILWAFGSTQGYWQSVVIDSVSADTFTIAAWPNAVTPSGTITYLVFGTPTQSAALPIPANIVQSGGTTVPAGAIPNAAAGAAGGLMISGTNAGTTTLGALTITGVTTHTGATVHTGNVSMAAGLNVTQSTSNTAALVVTGNGTGNGATFTSGSGATGQGINISSAATNGSALVCTAAGSGTGFSATGGASGKGILAAAGATGTAGLAVTGGGTSGAGITVTTTSGDAIQAIATAGNGLTVTANGTSKHGAVITGGTAGTSDGLKLVAGTGGIDLRGDITRNAMTESYPADGAAPTLAQALMLTMQSVGEVSVSGTTLTVNGLDGTTPVATYTLSDATNPTSRTRAS
jgi:hypothetical protein